MKNFTDRVTPLLSLAALCSQGFLLYYTLQGSLGATEIQMYGLYKNAADALYGNVCAHIHYQTVHNGPKGAYEIEYHEISDFLNTLEILSGAYRSGKLAQANFKTLYSSNIMTANQFLDNIKTEGNSNGEPYSEIRALASELRTDKGGGIDGLSLLFYSMCLMTGILAVLTVMTVVRPCLPEKRGNPPAAADDGEQEYLVRIMKH